MDNKAEGKYLLIQLKVKKKPSKKEGLIHYFGEVISLTSELLSR